MMVRRNRQRGSAAIEFSLAGIASIFLLICTFQLSMGMWNYHTISNAAHETSRFLAVKGENCVMPGNSCFVRIGAIAAKFKYHALGIPADQVILTLTTNSGASTTCSPLSTCLADATIWPPASNQDNKVGSRITVSAAYRFRSPLLFFWPGNRAVEFGEIWLPSSSSQTIIF
jgi:hypothetical protein